MLVCRWAGVVATVLQFALMLIALAIMAITWHSEDDCEKGHTSVYTLFWVYVMTQWFLVLSMFATRLVQKYIRILLVKANVKIPFQYCV